jgi:hypothetical protein
MVLFRLLQLLATEIPKHQMSNTLVLERAAAPPISLVVVVATRKKLIRKRKKMSLIAIKKLQMLWMKIQQLLNRLLRRLIECMDLLALDRWKKLMRY